MTPQIAIIGGGAAGFFLAIHVARLLPAARIAVMERSAHPLTKVRMSGGGRCNLTNSFAAVSDLRQVYPRGAQLLKRLFRIFDHRSAYAWFEEHGVPLVTQDDECVFPRSQNSESITLCLLRTARSLGVEVHPHTLIEAVERSTETGGFHLRTQRPELSGTTWDAVAVTTGGAPHSEGYGWLAALGHRLAAPCPSLFTFTLRHPPLTALTGLVVEEASVALAGTKFRAEGPLLITHRGVSGPAILRLSAHAARHLAACQYHAPLLIAWAGTTNAEAVAGQLTQLRAAAGQKLVGNVRPDYLQSRLWHYLLLRTGLSPDRRWSEIGTKGLRRLANILTADAYDIAGQNTHKEEFVTCGGVSLDAVEGRTLESRTCPGLFFAGEVLDIDGVTGGFNLTAAWTTAFVAAQGMAARLGASETQPFNQPHH